jgi:hypothetical protein
VFRLSSCSFRCCVVLKLLGSCDVLVLSMNHDYQESL